MIEIKVVNEYSMLEDVVLGIADDIGNVPKVSECYDPKSKIHVKAKLFPQEVHLKSQLSEFVQVLEKYNFNVIRPRKIEKLNQIFSRDIAFVIENILFIPNIINERSKEQLGIFDLVKKISPKNIDRLSNDVFIEGGDIIQNGSDIFIGYSKESDFLKYKVARTNEKAVNYIKKKFPKFNLNDIEDYYIWRAKYAQPITSLNYSKIIHLSFNLFSFRSIFSNQFLCQIKNLD